MSTITIWNLSIFCGFYGKIIPYYTNSESKEFTSFHTSTRNPDIEDLEVSFEPNLKPMTFFQLIEEARDLYIIGHGNSWRSMEGRVFYTDYTLYGEQGIVTYLKNIFMEDKMQNIWNKLKSWGQIKIDII